MTVLNEVSKGKYVIISINTPSGGHLVGVKGFAWRGKLTKVLVDDPFVYKYKKGKDTVYLLDNLKSVYKRNAIIIGE
jgi:hypothetical protein